MEGIKQLMYVFLILNLLFTLFYIAQCSGKIPEKNRLSKS